ncbi:hypothetical protein RRG08_065977 [Elysia crispata]|uniref:Kazal-like domain-containing protein n=1 Tax=Elysia crispata TaxID=231223 RepID=A0AAE1DSC0_9GAST|nr:hypothetical protein RRG08_065977 [Elysia crispata]
MHPQLLLSPEKRSSATSCISLFYLLLALSLSHISALSPFMLADDSSKYNVQCEECDESRCPVLSYCEGKAIKDSCNCCTVCSSPKYQPHVSVVGGELGVAAPLPATGDTPKHECGKVKCPRFQVCVANMQGLPLCKCPSEFLCRSNRKRAICGTDGITYESKCHMRIASCKQGMMVRKKHRGVCTPDDQREGESFKRKMRRRMRRRRRRRQKLEEATGGIGAATKGEGEVGEGGGRTDEDSLTSFPRGSDVLENQDRRGRLDQRTDNVGNQSGKREKRKDKKGKSKRRRRRKKNRKQRKQRKGGKRGKNDKRRRRRKRQYGKPRSRSKRHRNTKSVDDAEARARLFEEEFGQSTWFA